MNEYHQKITNVLSEDDHRSFDEFKEARKSNCIDRGILENARHVLSNKKLPHVTRLAAARLLIHTRNAQRESFFLQPFDDWIILSAMLEEATCNKRITKIIRAWMFLFEKWRVGESEDELMFLSSLSKTLAKKSYDLKEFFTINEMNLLQRYLLITFVILSELEYGAKCFEGALHFVANTMSINQNLFEFCFNELSLDLRSRYAILAALLRKATSYSLYKVESVIPTLCTQLSNGLHSQLLSTAAADFLAVLINWFPTSSHLIELFVRNITHHVKCIRSNVLRWIRRFQRNGKTVQFITSLQISIHKLFLSFNDDVWPPYIWETEDVSCIDSRWSSEETDDVLWEADRIINAYLNVSCILMQRFGVELDNKDPIIHAGMKWHLSETRLTAFHLWKICLGEAIKTPENNRILEKFILSNVLCSSTDLRETVITASVLCSMSSQGKVEWMKKVDSLGTQDSKEEHDSSHKRVISYLPKSLTANNMPQLPSAELSKYKLEECLRISGSHDFNSCPEFDVLYGNINKAGYDHRIFARYIIDIIDIIRFHEDVATALHLISDAITRCRLKVVVDHGCSVIDDLFSTHRYDKDFLSLAEHRYKWAISRLIDENTKCRTLALSRILWTVCEKFDVFLNNCFETLRSTLSNEILNERVHHRILKTIKLFTSKADCKVPTDFLEFLFWHCIDMQCQSGFLLRSAATILFGFIVRYITKSHVVPAFYIVSKSKKIWWEITRRCSSLVKMPFLQRILILSFLCQLFIGHVECYSAPVLQDIHALLSSLIELLNVTKDIRERRFCFEIIIAMSPNVAHQEMLKLVKGMQQNRIARVDCDFLMCSMKTSYELERDLAARKVPSDLLLSPFVKLIIRCEMYAPLDALKEINQVFLCIEPHSAEVCIQALAMAMTRVATNIKMFEHVDSRLRNSFVVQSIAILDFPNCSSRATSIISRIPVCLGLTKIYFQKHYVIEMLKRWMISDA